MGVLLSATALCLLAAWPMPRVSHGVLLAVPDDLHPQVPLSDLVAQSPLWAPETLEPVSDGYNAWMDTYPFGESAKHKRLREDWERRHAEDEQETQQPGARRSQTQMLRLQSLAPNIWTDYTMGGDGVKCVCDSAAAGDPEMEGMDPNVKPACTCSGGSMTQFTNTEEGGPLDTGGHGAWPQDLPGVQGGSDGAAYVDGIVGNNAYKAVGGATALASVQHVHDDGDKYAYGDDYRTTSSGQRQRAFDMEYDATNDFKYRGNGLFPEERHSVAPPMSGLWGSPPVEDSYEWNPSTLAGNGIAARRNAARKAQVQQQGTRIGELKKNLDDSYARDLTHPDTLGGTFGHTHELRWGNQLPGYGDPHTSRLED